MTAGSQQKNHTEKEAHCKCLNRIKIIWSGSLIIHQVDINI
jgi:hypothetical protein